MILLMLKGGNGYFVVLFTDLLVVQNKPIAIANKSNENTSKAPFIWRGVVV